MKKIPLTTIEFNVRGDEGYYVCLEFKKTRAEVIEAVKKVFATTADIIKPILETPAQPGESCAKEVKLTLKSTGSKAVKIIAKNVPISAVVKAEYALISGETVMMDTVTKL